MCKFLCFSCMILFVSTWCDDMIDMKFLYDYLTKVLLEVYVVDYSIMFVYEVYVKACVLMIGLLIRCVVTGLHMYIALVD